MRNILLFFIAIFFPIISACEKVETKYVDLSTLPKKTTVMVYMVGSDLIDGANKNIHSMLAADDSDKLNVVIQTGASAIEEQDETLKIDWTRVSRYSIKKNKLIKDETFDKKSCNEDGNPNCLNMLENKNLIDFLNYSKKNYPADRYVLILWNHGGGPTGGYGFEDTLAGDFSMEDISDVLSQADIDHYSLIGFDACLMGNVEIANTLSPYTDYLIASEEVEPGYGWDYTQFLTELATNPTVSIERVGKIIADDYIMNNINSGDTTLSFIETNDENMTDIIDKLNIVSNNLLTTFDTDKQATYVKYLQAKFDTRDYSFDYLIDSINFAQNLNSIFYDTDGDGNGNNQDVLNLIAALRKSIMYNIANTDWQEGSNGLSIYAPSNYSSIDAYKELFYKNDKINLNFSEKYIEFLDKIFNYQKELAKQYPDEPKFTTNTATSGSSVIAIFENHIGHKYISAIADADPVTDDIQIATSGIVTDCDFVDEGYYTYECNYTYDDKYFAYNVDGNDTDYEPIYLRLEKNVNKNVYDVELPLYLNVDGTMKFGYIKLKYDVDTSSLTLAAETFRYYNSYGYSVLSEDDNYILATFIYNEETKKLSASPNEVRGEIPLLDLLNNIKRIAPENPATKYAFEVYDVLGRSTFSNFTDVP